MQSLGCCLKILISPQRTQIHRSRLHFLCDHHRCKIYYKIPNLIQNKNVNQIKLSQKLATENVFRKKNIPFRSFTVHRRDEKTLGELFSFFILETILIGKMLNLNPYDQPAVELIKNETKKILT